MNRIVVFCIALVMLGVCACSNNCYVPTRALLGVSFLNAETLQPQDVTDLVVKGVGSDSVLYDMPTAINVIYLPLKPDGSSTSFDISFKSTQNEEQAGQYQLTVLHESYPQLISPECGCVMFHTIQGAQCSNESQTLQLEVYNPHVMNVENDVHLKIYL